MLEDAEDLGGQGCGSGGLGPWAEGVGGLLMATCWWIDTLPASAIFMMLLANSSSGGRQQGSELSTVWALPGPWSLGQGRGALTKAGSLLRPGQ